MDWNHYFSLTIIFVLHLLNLSSNIQYSLASDFSPSIHALELKMKLQYTTTLWGKDILGLTILPTSTSSPSSASGPLITVEETLALHQLLQTLLQNSPLNLRLGHVPSLLSASEGIDILLPATNVLNQEQLLQQWQQQLLEINLNCFSQWWQQLPPTTTLTLQGYLSQGTHTESKEHDLAAFQEQYLAFIQEQWPHSQCQQGDPQSLEIYLYEGVRNYIQAHIHGNSSTKNMDLHLLLLRPLKFMQLQWQKEAQKKQRNILQEKLKMLEQWKQEISLLGMDQEWDLHLQHPLSKLQQEQSMSLGHFSLIFFQGAQRDPLIAAHMASENYSKLQGLAFFLDILLNKCQQQNKISFIHCYPQHFISAIFQHREHRRFKFLYPVSTHKEL